MIHIPEVRVALIREKTLKYDASRLIHCSDDAAAILKEFFSDKDREHFVLLLMTTRHNIIGLNVAHIGSESESVASPASCLKAALLANAQAVILAHNHPSGCPSPSVEDKALTKKFVEAFRLCDIQVLDHIVIGGDEHFSFADSGLI